MRIILDVDDDFDVIGCASNGREAIEIAKKSAPDFARMDILPENLISSKQLQRDYQIRRLQAVSSSQKEP